MGRESKMLGYVDRVREIEQREGGKMRKMKLLSLSISL